jgi:hypothetical protein
VAKHFPAGWSLLVKAIRVPIPDLRYEILGAVESPSDAATGRSGHLLPMHRIAAARPAECSTDGLLGRFGIVGDRREARSGGDSW